MVWKLENKARELEKMVKEKEEGMLAIGEEKRDEWVETETKSDELGDPDSVRVKLPKKLKRRRQIENEDGPPGYQEYIDYLFPEETQTTNLKILEAAYKWKKQKVVSDDDED